MTPSEYRRETEAIERDAVRIRQIREQLLRDLAATPSVLPHHDNSQGE